jgi:hypothetical protein
LGCLQTPNWYFAVAWNRNSLFELERSFFQDAVVNLVQRGAPLVALAICWNFCAFSGAIRDFLELGKRQSETQSTARRQSLQEIPAVPWQPI